MPVKRRIDKSRHLDAYRREMLQYGPSAMLLAGCGYLGELMASHFDNASVEERAVILDAMRADWHRYGKLLMTDDWEWWAAKTFARSEE